MARCLRCKAGPEWIQGRVLREKSVNRTKRTLQANVIEAVSLANEANALKAELARMRPVFRKVAYWVKVWDTPAASIDGVYPKEIVDVFRAYERCARAARKAKGKR